MKILIRKLVSESLLMKVCQPSSEDLMFHLMGNYSCFLQGFGIEVLTVELNIARSSIAKTSLKSQLSYCQQMESQPWFVNFVPNSSRKNLNKKVSLHFHIT